MAATRTLATLSLALIASSALGAPPERIFIPPSPETASATDRFGLRSSAWAGTVCNVTSPDLCVEANLASSGGFVFNASTFPIAQPLHFGTDFISDVVTIEGIRCV